MSRVEAGGTRVLRLGGVAQRQHLQLVQVAPRLRVARRGRRGWEGDAVEDGAETWQHGGAQGGTWRQRPVEAAAGPMAQRQRCLGPGRSGLGRSRVGVGGRRIPPLAERAMPGDD